MSLDAFRRPLGAAAALAVAVGLAPGVRAQEAKPAEPAAVKIGGTIFADFTYNDAPSISDADLNTVKKSEFEVRRAYLNVTGSITKAISFRITPDVGSRASTTVSSSGLPEGTKVSGSGNYDGSLVLRLKYAFGQFALDDFATKGSWIRVGQQQTPYVDFIEGVYRYRFQGTVFVDREGYLSSSDLGLSGRIVLPKDHGELHVGFYNGDTYSKAEANDQKAFQLRGTLRPFPRLDRVKGLRVTAFYDLDHPVRDAERKRFVVAATYEHRYVNAAFEYLDARDSPSATKPVVHGRGFSVWATPRTTFGLEGLFRYDSLEPNRDAGARKRRTLAGVAYWFGMPKPGPAAAVLADFERVSYDAPLDRPTEKRIEIKTLFNF